MRRRVWQFIIELTRTWGGRVTGGWVIGIVGIWGLTGHPIAPIVGWAIGIGGIIIAAFQVWNRQVSTNEQLQADLELEKLKQDMPEVLLSVSSGLRFGEDPWEFRLDNPSEKDAFNVKIEDIAFPEGKATFTVISRLLPRVPSYPELTIHVESDPDITNFKTLVDNQSSSYYEAATTQESRDRPHPVLEIPITVTYTDISANKFIAKFQMFYDTSLEHGRAEAYLIDIKPQLST